MDFTSLMDIIDTGLSWFFSADMLATPTMSFFVDLLKFGLGFIAFYYIAIFPFVIAFRCIIRDWRLKK